MAQTKAQLVVGLNVNASAPASALQIDASGNINLDSNTLYVDATNNRVGIGTSTVDELLHLKGASAASTTLKVESTATASERSSIHFFNGSVSRGRVGGSNDFDGLTLDSSTTESAAAIRFRTGGTSLTTKMTLTSGGSLGIGTTNPQTTLHVKTATDNNLYVGPLGGAGTGVYLATVNDAGSLNVPLQIGNASQINFAINGTEAARIDSSRRLLVGTSSVISNNYGGTAGLLQVAKNDYLPIGFFTYSNNTGETGYCPYVELNRARGTQASPSAVGNGDDIGLINFYGHDGSSFTRAATIKAVVDAGVSGANDMPGRLVFSTTADGASSPTERMRINSSGYAKFANDGSPTNSTLSFHGFDNSGTDSTLYVNQKNTSFASAVFTVYAHRSASSAYNLATFNSSHVPGTTADIEFSFRGDGQAYADGSWNGGGADYAEYFEWSDGNADAEDRRGISVVLDGDKIREAIAGDDPIGVISGNPSVVGDAAWNKWTGKHLRDDFGTYILEDYEVEDEDGNTVIQQRRTLNPAYDPDQEYIPREQRPEWDCVGLMGKLRIRKGQVTGSRWIKMRDISDSVEEWLVR